MILSQAQLQSEDRAHWFCLKAHPKQEHLAAAALRRNLGVECFAPRIRFRKPTRRGPVWFSEALFPGYLFARFVYATQHRQVQYSAGVSAIVHFGSQVAALDDRALEGLRSIGGTDELVVFQPEPEPGQSVHIAEGAFQGLEAVVREVLPARERVKVLLSFLGRVVEAEIAAPQIVPTEAPRIGSLGR